MKVTEVSRHSYCMCYLLGSSAYAIALVINNQASELGKHPLFRQTVCGPEARPSAGRVTSAASTRRGEDAVGGQRDTRAWSTKSN
jgi:hypothetical protein